MDTSSNLMDDKANLAFRLVGLLIFGALAYLAGDKDYVDHVLDNPSRIMAVVLMVAALALVAVATVKHHPVFPTVCVIIGVLGAVLARDAMPKGSTVHLIVTLLALAIFTVWILIGLDVVRHFRQAQLEYEYGDEGVQADQDDHTTSETPVVSTTT